MPKKKIQIAARTFLAPVLLLLLFLVMAFIAIKSKEIPGGQDNLMHWKIAKYAWDYPILFFDLWGKPVYNFFSSPFAQFGLNGSKVFNVLLGIFTGYLAYLTAKRMGLRYPEWLIVAVVFTPVYFLMMISSMTEIIFSTILLASVYLILDKRYFSSALLVSFLPFARNESIVLFPVFIVVYIMVRQWKLIPLLAAGTVIISLAGLCCHNQIHWIYYSWPYTGDVSFYGSGDLLHFVRDLPNLMGYPLLITFIIGIILMLISLKTLSKEEWIKFFLLPGLFVTYFAAHSYVWWKGIGASLGLTRVIASVTPLAAITAWIGISYLAGLIKSKQIRETLFALLLIGIVLVPFTRFRLPLRIDREQQVVKEASLWLKDNKLTSNKIYFYDPFFFYYLDLNPYDPAQCRLNVPHVNDPGRDILINEIVVWDAHFGPHEGQLPLENLKDNPEFKLLKIIKPAEAFTTLNYKNYEIWIFQRTYSEFKVDSSSFAGSSTVPAHGKVLFYEDFEDKTKCLFDTLQVTNKYTSGGSYSYFLNYDVEYGPSYYDSYENLDLSSSKFIVAKVDVRPNTIDTENDITLVVSFENAQAIYSYNVLNFSAVPSNTFNDPWKAMELTVEIPETAQKGDILKVYLWNNKKQTFFLDNFLVYLR